MSAGDFASWFHKITGHAAPHDWQNQLAAVVSCRNRIIRIGTGLGKTNGVLAAWMWHHVRRSRNLLLRY